MKTLEKTMTSSRTILWFLVVNTPLLAITFYIHFLMATISESYGNNFLENFGLWFLVAFKIIGANLILMVIISDFKRTKS